MMQVTNVLLHAAKSKAVILFIKQMSFFSLNRLTSYVLQQILRYHSYSKEAIFLVNYGYTCPLSEEPKAQSVLFESEIFGIIYSDTHD